MSIDLPDLSTLPIVDANPILAPERRTLFELLSTLRADEWSAPTECPAWTVAGVALHVLGDDLSLLARQRDQAVDGLTLFGESRPELDFRQRLDGFNEQWVTAATFLSPQLIIELLELTGRETGAFYGSVDPNQLGEPVGLFLAVDASPYWQITAREYLERWIHQHQIRRALRRPDLGHDFLTVAGAVVTQMIAAHAQLLALAPGTRIVFEISGVAEWTVQVDEPQSLVYVGAAASPDATIAIDADRATPVLSRGLRAPEVPSTLRASGEEALCERLVQGFTLLAGRP